LVLTSGIALAEPPPSARALEARLLAPCCYGSTLDIHDSELAHDLRVEIETRIAHRETPDAIQADLVARYGEKIVAARSDSPIRTMGIVVALAALAAAGAIGVVLRRWTRAGSAPPPRAPERDVLDARIDADLADLDAQ
jgi:cytochrome c-type biogenesis protein CcmH